MLAACPAVLTKGLTEAARRRKVALWWLDRIVHPGGQAWRREHEALLFLFSVRVYVVETKPS